MAGEKREIRQKIRDLISAGSPEEGLGYVTLLEKDSFFRQAKAVALFASLPDEIPTTPIHDLCLRLNKTVVYPFMDEHKRLMRFYRVVDPRDPKEMATGPFKIQQPRLCPESVAVTKIDLFMVPGLAFSPTGGRLGRGHGFYDRTLSQSEFFQVVRYGLAYSFQIVEALPTEAFDVSVHKVFTPKKVYDCVSLGGGKPQ